MLNWINLTGPNLNSQRTVIKWEGFPFLTFGSCQELCHLNYF